MEGKIKSLTNKILVPSIIVVVTVTIISLILFRIFIKTEFNSYIYNKTQKELDGIATSINNVYNYENINGIEMGNNGMDALHKGFFISIYDNNGKKLWDIEEYNSGMCAEMSSLILENMKWRSAITENFKYEKRTLIKDGVSVGYLQIKYYGPIFYLDSDLEFINVVNNVIVLIGTFIIIGYILTISIISKKIKLQIDKLKLKATSISDGEYSRYNDLNYDILEIRNLAIEINNLSSKIEKQEDIRKRLTGDISHELKTPLTNIKSHLDAIIDGIWEPTTERLESIKEETERLTNLVIDMEKLNKFDKNSIILNVTTCKLLDCVREVINEFSVDIENKNMTVTIVGTELEVKGDKNKIKQLLINLISNAIRYSNDGGDIEVKLREMTYTAEILVIDNGIGIPKEELPFIFERFYRVDKSRTRATGGTGIGLTIAKSIVDAQGWSIRVKSNEGLGSKFIVTIPKE